MLIGLILTNVLAQPGNPLQPDSVRTLINRVAAWQINQWEEGRIIKLTNLFAELTIDMKNSPIAAYRNIPNQIFIWYTWSDSYGPDDM
ncbi:hypothetical protein SAMN05216436_13132 [bacterium A37T11]|nr:hypothetical protein SAMN05216436_13132 [bacterium A37T11]